MKDRRAVCLVYAIRARIHVYCVRGVSQTQQHTTTTTTMRRPVDAATQRRKRVSRVCVRRYAYALRRNRVQYVVVVVVSGDAVGWDNVMAYSATLFALIGNCISEQSRLTMLNVADNCAVKRCGAVKCAVKCTVQMGLSSACKSLRCRSPLYLCC